MNVIDWAQFPYISCNFYHEENSVKKAPVLAPYEIFEIGGRKIAFIGMTTPETFTKSTPAYFQDGNGNYIYGISDGEDGAALYADVQAAIAEVDADYVIGLAHLGDDPASQLWTSEKVIANVTGQDAFIDGHSHSTVVGKDVNGVWLTQTGEYFGNIGMMLIDGETGAVVLDEDGGEVTEVVGYEFVSSFDLGTAWASDEAVAAIKDAWIAEIDTQLGQTIGSTALTFDNYDADGNRLVRSQETNTGDFAADALYYLFDNMFSGAVNVLDYVMEDYMVLANYIQGFEGGVVDATNSPLAARFPGMLVDYSTVNGSGRIVMEAAAR